MPNWCSNRFEVQGSKEQMDEFEKFLNEKDGKDWFDFFAPTPEELKEDGWYEWNVDNWGCKWNCDAQGWERHGEDTITFSFDSPWSPPIALYDKITESGLTVFASYHEEGMAFVGEYREGFDETFAYTDLESLEEIPEDLIEEWNLREVIEYYEDEDNDETS